MTQEPQATNRTGWVEAIGLPHIARTLGFAVDPGKLGIAAAAIIATIVWGGALDWAWKTAGAGVQVDAITRMAIACQFNAPHEEQAGEEGIFAVWQFHQTRCVRGLMRLPVWGSPVTALPLSVETPGGEVMTRTGNLTRMGSLRGMGYGAWWSFRYHTLYFLLFGIGALLIWSWAGGALCRMAAVQFARDEKLTLGQGLASAKGKFLGGYFLAPLIPLIFALVVVVVMVIGGAVLRIPVLGDILCGAAFFLAIIGGFIVAVLMIGLVVGGSLLWPTVAAEGSDAFDVFSRSLSYVFSKPWKTVVYAVLTGVYASICWWVVRWVTFLGLKATHCAVSFGTSPFGVWSRGDEASPVSKLDLIWPFAGLEAMHTWPDWSALAWYECISAAFVGFFVLLALALMWSFLCSFYFSGSTVIYMLLRRDVDGTDLEDIYFDEEADEPEPAPATAEPATEAAPPIESPPQADEDNDTST